MSNKFYKDNHGETVCCMIEGMGLVIGRLSSMEEGLSLKNPRVVQTQHTPPDPPQLRLGELIGSPDDLRMIRQPVFLYKILNKSIKDLYIQTTTGLVLADKINNLKIVK
jgi:hypothetical protein